MVHDHRMQRAGTGPPLVYVPGMDGTGLLFYRQVPRLSSDYTVVTYRLRDAARVMRTLVDDLAEVCSAAGAGPALLVGESFGGALAMSFALAHPDRVRGLVVLNSFPHFEPQGRLALALLGVGMMPWGAMRAVRRLTAHRLHAGRTPSNDMQAFFRLTASTTREGYRNRLRILRRYDVRGGLARLAVPVLYLAADRDRLIPSVEQAHLMASLAPSSAVRVLAGYGHSCFLADGIDLAEILRDWLPRVRTEQAAAPVG